jgi:hypothetical protein
MEPELALFIRAGVLGSSSDFADEQIDAREPTFFIPVVMPGLAGSFPPESDCSSYSTRLALTRVELLKRAERMGSLRLDGSENRSRTAWSICMQQPAAGKSCTFPAMGKFKEGTFDAVGDVAMKLEVISAAYLNQNVANLGCLPQSELC